MEKHSIYMPIDNYAKEYRIFKILIGIGSLLCSYQSALAALKETRVQADNFGFGKGFLNSYVESSLVKLMRNVQGSTTLALCYWNWKRTIEDMIHSDQHQLFFNEWQKVYYGSFCTAHMVFS